ncbi:MAG: hypothetical protein R8G34_23000 [Paracoccaceae bacterium]|nr:hypothetical protein [Paracoccaceae bacterium]
MLGQIARWIFVNRHDTPIPVAQTLKDGLPARDDFVILDAQCEALELGNFAFMVAAGSIAEDANGTQLVQPCIRVGDYRFFSMQPARNEKNIVFDLIADVQK